MMYYVLSDTDPFETMCKIQKNNMEDSYYCRETFAHFDKINAPKEAKDEAIKDFLSVLDGIVIVGNITEDMSVELDFAEEINMEVEYLENTE